MEIWLHSFDGMAYWFGILVCCARSLAVWENQTKELEQEQAVASKNQSHVLGFVE